MHASFCNRWDYVSQKHQILLLQLFPILINTVSWFLPDRTLFTWCDTCLAAWDINSLSKSLLGWLSDVFLMCFWEFPPWWSRSLLLRPGFSLFLLLQRICEVIVLATLQALFPEHWAILARFVTVCFPTVATHLSRLLPFLLWLITFGVWSVCFCLFPTSEFVISL